MKFLADMGVSTSTVLALRHLSHDVVHLRDQGLIRMEDPDIVKKAKQEGRIVLTFDLDFGEIMALFRLREILRHSVSHEKSNASCGSPRLLQVIQECKSQPPQALL